MSLWATTIAKMPRLKDAPQPRADKRPAAYPLCAIPGGICDSLLSSIPMSIIGIQFIRDENDVVQDGLVIFANGYADRVFNSGEPLLGSRFTMTCQEILLAGIWQRCLWVAAHGKGETMVEKTDGKDRRFLSIWPYGDGLILSRSIDPDLLMHS